tara:strand:+ start:7373 stop:9100 length:1728 start_codon:yes stop_codon:yes gene_type:complete
MSATPNINLLKIKGNKFDATSAPSATDDSSAGYQVGSVWIDVTNDKAYFCVDATASNAVWNEAGGGGGSSIYTADGTIGTGRNVTITDTLNFGNIKIDDSNIINNMVLLGYKGVLTSISNYNLLMNTSGHLALNSTALINFNMNNQISGKLHTDKTWSFGSHITKLSSAKVEIKGEGTGTGITLALYDDDTTPNKTWDWLDNGNVNLGQATTFNSTVQEIIKLSSNALNPYISIDATAGTNHSSYLVKRQGTDKWLFGNEGSSDSFRIRNLQTPLNPIVITNANAIEMAGNASSISTSSIAAFIAKGDGSSVDGYIQLNCSQNSHGIKLKSPPHSANASYTLTLPDDTGSNGQALTTDGSGNLSWGAGTSTDSDAIHDNVASEISAIAAKTTLVNNDILLIEDSADSNNKKKTTIADIKTAVSDVGTPGIAQSINSFALANTTTNSAITNEVYSVKVIPTVLRDVTKMSFFVTSIAAGQITSVGIYNNSGTLLAQGSVAASALGIRTANLNTTVTLAANTEYYFSIWDSNGTANYASKALFNLDILGKAGPHSSSTLPSSMPGSATNKCFWLNAF